MKTKWETKKLGDVCEISAGSPAPQMEEMFEDGQHPFFRTSDVGKIHIGSIYDSKDKLNEEGMNSLKSFSKGTLLFPKSGASTFLNHRVMMEVDGCVSSHLATIKATKDLTDKFLFYYSLLIDSRNLMQNQSYPSLRLSDIENIEINYPSLEEQKQIVKILEEVFESISKSKKNAEKNLKNAKELFESYLEEVFSNPKEDWEEKRLEELGKRKNAIVSGPFGSNLKVKDYKEEGIPLIRLQNIQRRLFLDKAIRYISLKKAEELKSHSFIKGDIVLAKLGIPIGKTCRVPNAFKEGIIVADVVRIRLDKEKVDYDFMTYYLNSDNSTTQLNGNIVGATRPRVNLSDVREIKLFLPSLSEQKQIVSKLDSLSKEIKELEAIYKQKVNDLDELKKSMLQKAFNGELTKK